MGHRMTVIRGKFIARSAYSNIERIERSQINDLMLYLKLLEKQERTESKIIRKEMVKK
jgi:hypothetical protein